MKKNKIDLSFISDIIKSHIDEFNYGYHEGHYSLEHRNNSVGALEDLHADVEQFIKQVNKITEIKNED